MVEVTEKRVLPNELMLGEVSLLLAEGHTVTILTKGCSMLPFIRGEVDSVFLRFHDEIHTGDIVLAEISQGLYVLHRIISIDGENLVLKGDGNLDSTEKCLKKDVKGVAERICRPGGKETDCFSPAFAAVSLRWRRLPRMVRRLFLAFYRRMIKLI